MKEKVKCCSLIEVSHIGKYLNSVVCELFFNCLLVLLLLTQPKSNGH